jgi:hypothetical protein
MSLGSDKSGWVGHVLPRLDKYNNLSLNHLTKLLNMVLEGIHLCGFFWRLGMSLGATYPKFSPKTCSNNLLKIEHCRAKK